MEIFLLADSCKVFYTQDGAVLQQFVEGKNLTNSPKILYKHVTLWRQRLFLKLFCLCLE